MNAYTNVNESYIFSKNVVDWAVGFYSFLNENQVLHWTDQELESYSSEVGVLDMIDRFERGADLDFEVESTVINEDHHLLVYGNYTHIDNLVAFLQCVLTYWDLPHVLALEWSNTGDCEGGGAVVITKNDIRSMETHFWVHTTREAVVLESLRKDDDYFLHVFGFERPAPLYLKSGVTKKSILDKIANVLTGYPQHWDDLPFDKEKCSLRDLTSWQEIHDGYNRHHGFTMIERAKFYLEVVAIEQ